MVLNTHPLTWPEAFVITSIVVSMLGSLCFLTWLALRGGKK